MSVADFFQNLLTPIEAVGRGIGTVGKGLYHATAAYQNQLARQQSADVLRERLNLEQSNSQWEHQHAQDLLDQQNRDDAFNQQMRIGQGVSSGLLTPASPEPGDYGGETSGNFGPGVIQGPNGMGGYRFTTPDEQAAFVQKQTRTTQQASDDEFNNRMTALQQGNPTWFAKNPDAIAAAQFHHYTGIEPPKGPTSDQVTAQLMLAATDPNGTPQSRQAAQEQIDHFAGLKHPQSNAGGDQMELSPQALDMSARQYLLTGQMPGFGMGNAAVAARKAVMNRAAELSGSDPKFDLASNQAAFRANQGALAGLVKQREPLVAFENTAKKNLDMFLQQARGVPDTNAPWMNKPLREVDTKALGNDELPAYNAARQVALNELAKINSNPGLTGQLTDTARKEFEAFLPADATYNQIVKVAGVLTRDTENRRDELDQQIADLTGRISKGAQGLRSLPQSSTTPAPGTPVVSSTPPPGITPPPAVPRPAQKGQKLDSDNARSILKMFNGNKDAARKAAQDAGWVLQ